MYFLQLITDKLHKQPMVYLLKHIVVIVAVVVDMAGRQSDILPVHP